MHGLNDQLSATKENAQMVNSKCFSCCVVRGGSRQKALLHPAASFLEVCELPTSLLHSPGIAQWIQNLLTIGKNWQMQWLQILQLCTHWQKNWEYSSKCLRWLCPSQRVEVILFPGEVETSDSCWSLSSEMHRCCCWPLEKLLATQGLGFLWLWDC